MAQVNIDLTSPATSSHTQILTEPGRKKLIHFACQFEALGSGILRIRKQFQIFHFQGPQTVRQSKSTSSGRFEDLCYAWTKKLIQFACQFEALGKWNIANPKTVPES
jgi:hypothetical protein